MTILRMARAGAARRIPAAGVVLAAFFLAVPAGGASFDCAGAKAPDEAAVCRDCDLAQLDVKMDTLYGVATRLVAMGQRGDLRDGQRAWLKRRALCGGDGACLKAAYQAHIGELEAVLSAISARGPF